MTLHPGRRKLLFQAASNLRWNSDQREFAVRIALRIPKAEVVPEAIWQQLRAYTEATAQRDHATAGRILDDLLARHTPLPPKEARCRGTSGPTSPSTTA